MDTRFTGASSSFYCVAMRLALRDIETDEVRDLVQYSIDNPGPDAVRAVLKAGFGKPWATRIEHAMIEIGIAASGMLECRS